MPTAFPAENGEGAEPAAAKAEPAAKPEPKAGDIFTSPTIGQEFVWIPATGPAGFMMGSPATENDRDGDETRHSVILTKGFWLGATEVTRGQFGKFVQGSTYRTDAEKEGWSYAWDGKTWGKVKGASWRNPGFAQDDGHPVVCVSWNDATAFCEWLSGKENRRYRLPTEAEWEYACRAGSDAAYCWGDDPDDGRGWCNGADQTAKGQFPGLTVFTWADGYVFTAPVGKFKKNAFGLFDMHGNVWEWCHDRYGDYPGGDATNPTGPANGASRVVRGGSWYGSPGYCRSANRYRIAPDYRRDFLTGFRLALDSE